MIRIACVAAAVCVGVAALPARAEGKPFGSPGEVVITNHFALSLSHSNSGSSYSAIQLSPHADVFVLPGLSLGGGPTYVRSWWSSDETADHERIGGSSDALGVTFRVGYALNVSESVSIWPNAGVAYGRAWWRAESEGDVVDRDSGFQFDVGGGLPLLVHVAPSFFFGFGPGISRELRGYRGDETRTLHVYANTFMGGRL